MKRTMTFCAVLWGMFFALSAADFDTVYVNDFSTVTNHLSGLAEWDNIANDKGWNAGAGDAAKLIPGAEASVYDGGKLSNFVNRGSMLNQALHSSGAWANDIMVRASVDLEFYSICTRANFDFMIFGLTTAADVAKDNTLAFAFKSLAGGDAGGVQAKLFDDADSTQVIDLLASELAMRDQIRCVYELKKLATTGDFFLSLSIEKITGGNFPGGTKVVSDTISRAGAYAAATDLKFFGRANLMWGTDKESTMCYTLWDKVMIAVEQPAMAPAVAYAGDDFEIVSGTDTTLMGASNYDDDSEATVSFAWTAPDGVTLSDTSIAQPSFSIDVDQKVAFYTFSLVVTVDKDGSLQQSNPQEVRVLVLPEEGKYDSGTGTASDPYILKNAHHLYNLSMLIDDWSAYVKLGANIDMANTLFYPIGATVNAEDKFFDKVFDGDHYTISNLTITKRPTQSGLYGGLIGMLTGGQAGIKNLGLIHVSANFGQELERVGAFAGQARWGAIIENCFVLDGDTISGSQRVGGISGFNGKTTLENCFVDAIVSGGSNSGGLCGEMSEWEDNTLTNLAFYGTKIGGNAVRGEDKGTGEKVTNASGVYYAQDCGATSDIGTALSASQLLVEDSYANFNFFSDWTISTEDGFAILKDFDGNAAFLHKADLGNLYVYPNPVSRVLTLSETVKVASVFNLNGVLLQTVSNTPSIDVSRLASGVYLLKLDQEFIRFVKQ